MANLTVTAASVLASASATVEKVTAGATVTAGQPVYKDSSDGDQYKPAQATSTKENAVGIALTASSDGQPLVICKKDSGFKPGATVAVGVVYAVSATSGAIAPIGDLTTNDYATIIGVGTSTSTINMDLTAGLRAQAAIA